MPAWSNTDASATKPKWDVERQTREVVRLSTANTTNAGNNTVTFVYNDGAGNNVANVGIAVGQYVYFGTGLAGNGYPGFFASNNTVKSINGNNVTLNSNVFANTAAGVQIEFDNAISWSGNKFMFGGSAYTANTVLVTPTRSTSGQNVSMGGVTPGWVNITKTTNGLTGEVRYRHETLVALANPVASNTWSGNTAWGSPFTGT